MPQIRCPNCGYSINLETRRKMDFYIISKNLQSGKKSFTQLLRTTKLPRKTLNLRLNELIKRGTIIKDNGYRLSEASQAAPTKYQVNRGYELKSKIYRFLKENPNGNRDAVIITAFLAFLVIGPLLFANSFVAYAHRVHNFDIQPLTTEEFTITINIRDAVDLFAWQGEIKFDADILVPLNVAAGDFLSSEALVINATGGFITEMPQLADSTLIFANDEPGVLFIGGSLFGNVAGKSGSGRLTAITFRIASDVQRSFAVNVEGDIILLNAEMLDTEGILEIGI